MEEKVYVVVATEWGEFMGIDVFAEKFEAEKYIRHTITDDTKREKLELIEVQIIK